VKRYAEARTSTETTQRLDSRHPDGPHPDGRHTDGRQDGHPVEARTG
jgi:hypothetical protein